MAYEIPSFYVGVLPADIDMSAEVGEYYTYQYRGVCVYTAVSTQGTGIGGAALIPPSGASTPIIGVLQNNPQQGEAGQVMVQGVSKAQAAASFSIGTLLMVNSSGQFLAATSTNFAVAQALENANSGDITTVLLIRNGKQ
jgi:Uncharacterized conserved protein (DUF2190)